MMLIRYLALPFLLSSCLAHRGELTDRKDIEHEAKSYELVGEDRDKIKAQTIIDLYRAGATSFFLFDTKTNRTLGHFSIRDKPKESLGLTGGSQVLRPENSIELKGLVYEFPEGYVPKKALGDGSVGLVFLVKKDGSPTTVKYFKGEAVRLLAEDVLEFERIAEKSVFDPESLTESEKAILRSPSSGVAEDILYGTQQEAEQAKRLGVTLDEFRNPEKITSPQLKQYVMEVQRTGVGSVRAIAIDINVTIEGEGVKTVTALEKRLISGRNLKDLIEQGRVNFDMVSSIRQQLTNMSMNGLIYQDLNEANWFVETKETAVPISRQEYEASMKLTPEQRKSSLLPDQSDVFYREVFSEDVDPLAGKRVVDGYEKVIVSYGLATPFDMKPGIPITFTDNHYKAMIPGWGNLTTAEKEAFKAKKGGEYLDKVLEAIANENQLPKLQQQAWERLKAGKGKPTDKLFVEMRQECLEQLFEHLESQKIAVAQAETARAMEEKTNPLGTLSDFPQEPSTPRNVLVMLKQKAGKGLFHAKIETPEAQRSMNMINEMLKGMQEFELQPFRLRVR